MDWRIVVVLAPVALAASWAVFNIGRAALGQLQTFLDSREA
ncbi:photosystem II protein Y [Oscillatoria sp. CS-180]|nr:photosystem II protein Y [Oscillatoria sp. CS-180]MDB9524490.1 photosystem II protein Y [Oscillatoria sp. CS-180]